MSSQTFNSSGSQSTQRGDLEQAKGHRFPADAMLPLVYQRLRQLARERMGNERGDHTLQATALVHEAYLRLAVPSSSGAGSRGWANAAHFFHSAAEVMRCILVDHARARGTLKRGGAGGAGDARQRFDLGIADDLAAPAPLDWFESVALHEAISRLEEQEPLLAAVVRLRFFNGLSVDETAEALDISPRSVKRDWLFARAWLLRELGSS